MQWFGSPLGARAEMPAAEGMSSCQWWSIVVKDDMGKGWRWPHHCAELHGFALHSHLLWLAVQARADTFLHSIESSADDIASSQFGQGGLVEMPFKRAGVSYETARKVRLTTCHYMTLCCRHPTDTCLEDYRSYLLLQYMEQTFKEKGYCTNGDVSHVVMKSNSLIYMANKA